MDVCIDGKQLRVTPAAALGFKCLSRPSACPSTYHTSCKGFQKNGALCFICTTCADKT